MGRATGRPRQFSLSTGHLLYIRDCDRAISAQPSYSKAWYRRSLLKCDMGDYSGAVIDMEKALAYETTPGSRSHIKWELAQIELRKISTQDHQNGILNSTSPNITANRTGTDGLQKHWTKEKGWSLQTKEDLPRGSLIFQEDPYAAVILKAVRQTNCHFCFEKLPADPVPCSGCAIPLYCSDICGHTATGCVGCHDPKYRGNIESSPKCLEPDNAAASSCTLISPSVNGKLQTDGISDYPSRRWGEHTLECGGASWSTVLPAEAILAARMLFRTSIMVDGLPTRNLNLVGGAEESEVHTLCNHYDNFHPNDKLELHVLGIVLGYCLNQCTASLLKTGSIAAVASKVILLMAQVRVNAMAITTMVSSEFGEDLGDRNHSEKENDLKSYLTSPSVCTVEQVKVAQGIFLLGSRLNHSCIPNIHSSFASGRLSVRAVTDIPQGSPLELCYGPQVGNLNQLERKQALSEEYFFSCNCPGCSKLTLPDLLLRAFQCTKPGCLGAVLGPQSLESKFGHEKDSTFGTHMVVAEHERMELSSPGVESKRRRQILLAVIDVKSVAKRFSKASHVYEKNIGSCLCCGTVVDVITANEVAGKASAFLEGVVGDVAKAESRGRDVNRELTGAVNALNSLRATAHAYNQQLAKGEDIVARLLCDLDQPLKALKHCKSSIEILEHLYNKEHIVIGNEYLKLASIAVMASDIECARWSIAMVDRIFIVHYGSDYASKISYVAHLQGLVKQR